MGRLDEIEARLNSGDCDPMDEAEDLLETARDLLAALEAVCEAWPLLPPDHNDRERTFWYRVMPLVDAALKKAQG